MHPAFHYPHNINSRDLTPYLVSFTRRFTLKDCLPELPRKIFYDWKKEGLIPDSFGVEKSLNIISEAKPSYKKWDRYHLYELIWIRLIYHCRDLGLAKSILRKAAKENFPSSTRLKRRVEMQMRKKNKEFLSAQKQLTENLGKKGAAHELNKITSTVAESVESSDFHRNIFTALSKRKGFDFILRKREISISEVTWHNDTGPVKKQADISPYVGIPFAYILNDVVRNSDLDYLKDLLCLTEEESKIALAWKGTAMELCSNRTSKNSSLVRTAAPKLELDEDQLKVKMSSYFELLVGLPHVDGKELEKFKAAAFKEKKAGIKKLTTLKIKNG